MTDTSSPDAAQATTAAAARQVVATSTILGSLEPPPFLQAKYRVNFAASSEEITGMKASCMRHGP